MPDAMTQKPSLAERIPELGITLKYVSEVGHGSYFAGLVCGDRELQLTDIRASKKPTLVEIVWLNLATYDIWANQQERSFPKYARQCMSAEKVDADEIEDLFASFETQSIRCREIETFYGEHFSTLLYDTNWIEA